ncbi:MAG: Coenzyme F420 hydrogenase/dehydrogenase, beta subunit C-terminal domain [Candidatus Methanofastidiosia archaeon]
MDGVGLSQCGYEQGLKKEIVDTNKCCRCGTCAAVCPKNRERRSYNPLMAASLNSLGVKTHSNEVCTLCLDTCPIQNQEKNGGIGDIVAVWRARAVDDSLRKDCQDGGACTAFLESLTKHRIVNVKDKQWRPDAVFGKELRTAAGSKYSATSSLSLLPLRHNKIAFVGLPCQMSGITSAQKHGLLPEITLKVGLFCTKNFIFEPLRDTIEAHGIKMDEIKKMEISKRFTLTLDNGEKRKLSLSSLKGCVVPGCDHCMDFCAFKSDIVFGSVGTGKGYTTVIARTKEAETLFKSAVEKHFIVADEKVVLKDILFMQEKKAKRNKNG